MRITYVFDAYCAWCYGFAPTLHAFAEQRADRIDLRVVSGGLFTGERVQPTSAYPYIPEADARIARLRGVTFGPSYSRAIAAGTNVLNSTDAATGFVALRQQPGARLLDLTEAMQHAWYHDGRSLSDPGVYRDIAAEQGLDPAAVVAAFEAPETRATALEDFREARRLGVDSYPTLLARTDDGILRLGGAGSSAAGLTEAFDRHAAVAAR